MWRWLRSGRAASAASPSDDELLNEGLELAMDWGENWLAPVQSRLSKRHPRLDRDRLDAIDAAAQRAMTSGHEAAYALVRLHGKDLDPDEFTRRVRAAHPWIDDANAARLFTQSTYYAWKAGGPPTGR